MAACIRTAILASLYMYIQTSVYSTDVRTNFRAVVRTVVRTDVLTGVRTDVQTEGFYNKAIRIWLSCLDKVFDDNNKRSQQEFVADTQPSITCVFMYILVVGWVGLGDITPVTSGALYLQNPSIHPSIDITELCICISW